MIPILYESTEREFQTNGLGVLSECTSCLATWSGNKLVDLEMEYPEDGRLAPEIMADRIILAKPTPFRDPQPFRIKRRTESIGGVFTVYAEHAAYDLKGVSVGAYEAEGVVFALQRLKENALNDCPFEFWTDKTTTGKYSRLVPSNAWDILGGTSGSILDQYGGQYEFDRWTVRLHKQLGKDSGVVVEYGKNLTTMEMERNIAKLYSGVCPFWANQDKSVVVMCDPKIVTIEGEFDRSNVLTLDLSGEWMEAPTPEALLARTQQYITENDLGKPTVALDFSFVQLSQTDEYSWLSRLEQCEVFDTVTVRLLKQKIDVTATITETVTNVLTERYDSIKIGSTRKTISDTVNDQQKEIAKKPDLGLVEQIAGQIAGAILGAKGGSARLIDTNADGMPDTLYIADHEDPAQAKKVWRFNYEGWAASKNGYNGPFTMAASLEDGFYGDFITAGILTANLIRAGVLASTDGLSYWNLETGLVVFSNDKTYNYSDYTEDDETRLRDIVLGTVKPTEEDYAKYDFYQDGKITNTDRVLLRNMLNNQQNIPIKWECKFSSSTPGELITVTATNMISGTSYKIFALGSQNRISIESGETLSTAGILDYIYPVGSIYLSVSPNNPSSLFGGAWVAWGSGRVPVGVNTSDSSFSTVEKTGGEKTHTLSVNEIPSHQHITSGAWGVEVSEGYKYTGTFNVNDSAKGLLTEKQNMKVGGGAAHNNLQPYITCYMWKRTA